MIRQNIKCNWIRELMLLMALCLQFSLFNAPLSIAYAQTGSWKAYMAYSEPQQIVKADQRLFVRASNNLYNYHLTDHSIETYDKIRQLSDNNIEMIAWTPDGLHRP